MVGEGEVVVSWSASGVATSRSVFVPATGRDQLGAHEVEAVATGGDGAIWFACGCDAYAEVLTVAVASGVGRPLHACVQESCVQESPAPNADDPGSCVQAEPVPTVEAEWLSTVEAAALLGVDRGTLDRMRDRAPRSLPGAPVAVGEGKERRSWRWRRATLSAWAEAYQTWAATTGRRKAARS